VLTHYYFVPPAFAADAIMEAADAGIKVIIALQKESCCYD
jgi:succinyl-CoA synthetase alpha subunit